MAYTTINKSTEYFSSDIWSGNSGTQTISAGGQRDMTWFKVRNGTRVHRLQDAVRGVTKALIPNDTAAEGSETTMITAFNSSGYTTGSDADINASGSNYVGWSWKANGAGSANTDGSINSTVSANTTSGFSIVNFTGSGSAATVGHGLGAVPKMIIVKKTTTSDWNVYHNSLGNTKAVKLNSTNSDFTQANRWNSTTPTTSVFSVGDSGDTNSGNVMAYCFAEKQGYSKCSSYTGNGNADGTFVYTGFKPAWIMFKRTDYEPYNWFMLDNKRQGFNPANETLSPNTSSEASSTGLSVNTLDFLSNGFKMKTNNAEFNASGATYIYMAFAEAPLVGTNNTPCTAR